jgi:hypothetical protein
MSTVLEPSSERAAANGDASVEELRELEALWHAAPAARRRRTRSWPDGATRRVTTILLWGWPAVFASILVLTPAAEPVDVPVWVDVAGVGVVFGPLAALWVGTFSLRGALAVGAGAGAPGVVLGLACRSTGHHAGLCWAYEASRSGSSARPR